MTKSRVKSVLNYLVNRFIVLRMDIKSAKNARKKLDAILAQDGSILDKYGFVQGTDKASLTNLVGGVTFSERIFY